MNTLFLTGTMELKIGVISHEKEIIDLDSSSVDNTVIEEHLSTIESTLYDFVSKKELVTNKAQYNILFCGNLDFEKKEFSILDIEVCALEHDMAESLNDNDWS